MTIREIYEGSDGDATKALYAKLEALGPIGIVAMNIFRAQKASERAKVYRRRYKCQAYEKKVWSLNLLCDALTRRAVGHGIRFGWKRDAEKPGDFPWPWVLYVDLPTGQASFHTATRGDGPDYVGEWDQKSHSVESIIKWVSFIVGEAALSEASDPDFEDRPVGENYYLKDLADWKRKHGI